MAVFDIFRKTPIEVPNKSGFDESHTNLFSAKCGTLIPVLTDELLPNDTIDLSVISQFQLPPMATDFYGRVRAHFEAFFVPNRLLFGGWKNFVSSFVDSNLGHQVSGDPLSDNFPYHGSKFLPGIRIPNPRHQQVLPDDYTMLQFRNGSLLDYLGFDFPTYHHAADTDYLSISNPLRLVAYHRIWNDWYRDSRVQVPCFVPPAMGSQSSGLPTSAKKVGCMPSLSTPSDSKYWIDGFDACRLWDSVPIFALRQRNWAKDCFTNSTPRPQQGSEMEVKFSTSGQNGSFSIAQLRQANALQQWLERNNVTGFRDGDIIFGHFGVYPTDSVQQRPLYLGRQVFDVYNRSVYMSGANNLNESAFDLAGQNPFGGSIGSKFGSPQGSGNGHLGKFTATEHGILMVIFSLVPDRIYNLGIHPVFRASSPLDFPWPMLAGVGDEEVFGSELYCAEDAGLSTSFGYRQRYSRNKFMPDEVHGELRDGYSSYGGSGSLKYFALTSPQKSETPTIDTDFLEIPRNYLDGVKAVSIDDASQRDAWNVDVWSESYFRYRKISTLPAYSLPTLGDMKNTHTEVIDTGGTRL